MPRFLRNVSGILLSPSLKELRQFWRLKDFQPSANIGYLIKWPVSIRHSTDEPKLTELHASANDALQCQMYLSFIAK